MNCVRKTSPPDFQLPPRRRFRGLAVAAGLLTLTALLAGRAGAADELVPLVLKLPAPMFIGTPKDMPASPNLEKPSDKPRPPLLVPKGVSNLAPASTVTTSSTNATAANLRKIVDGSKEPSDAGTVMLRKGTQFLQFDLGAAYDLFAIVIWHSHDSPKVYHDVVVRVADDADFKTNVRTLFNNDYDDSSHLGAGTDKEYFESHEGRLVDAKGAHARYVRTYSKGSTDSALNEYTEVEIYGRPAQ